MNNASIKILLCTISFAWSLSAFAETQDLPKQHPEEIETAPYCSDCHEDAKRVLDHTRDFAKRHKFYAYQQKAVCMICHKESFCMDCHANKEEIKPSDKFKDAPKRSFPHRGDYITRHKIDGRINPAACIKCHGRRNNARCKLCHR